MNLGGENNHETAGEAHTLLLRVPAAYFLAALINCLNLIVSLRRVGLCASTGSSSYVPFAVHSFLFLVVKIPWSSLRIAALSREVEGDMVRRASP